MRSEECRIRKPTTLHFALSTLHLHGGGELVEETNQGFETFNRMPPTFDLEPLICANATLMNVNATLKPEIYKDEGYRFIGAAFEVYNDRGYGLAEEIYQECLEIELELREISFQSKAELRSFYKGRELKKRYIPDLFVSGSLVVELKAVTDLAPEHEAQLLNYMRLAHQPVGYLVNFGHKDTLEWKRFILSEYIRPPSG